MAKITHIRGDSRRVDIVFKDANGQPADLTGATVYFTVQHNRDNPDDTTALFQKTTTTHDDATAGLTHIQIDSNDTQDATAGLYWYDAEVVDPNGNVTSKKSNIFKILADTTRVNTL